MDRTKTARPKRADIGRPRAKRSKLKIEPTQAPDADAALDEALEQTFPASDPVAMESTLVPGRQR